VSLGLFRKVKLLDSIYDWCGTWLIVHFLVFDSTGINNQTQKYMVDELIRYFFQKHFPNCHLIGDGIFLQRIFFGKTLQKIKVRI
jgi:hypothetical protein